jgi:hypothetical protein
VKPYAPSGREVYEWSVFLLLHHRLISCMTNFSKIMSLWKSSLAQAEAYATLSSPPKKTLFLQVRYEFGIPEGDYFTQRIISCELYV